MDVKKTNEKIIKYVGMDENIARSERYGSVDELYDNYFHKLKKAKRYNNVHYLFSYFENALAKQLESGLISKEDILDYINLSYMVYDALAISTMDPFGVMLYCDPRDDYEVKRFERNVCNHFMNLSPINFFKLINDLSNQNFYHSSREIADKFLMNIRELRNINKFYNELSDIYIKNHKHSYTFIYLYVVTTTNYLNKFTGMQKLLKLANSKYKEKRKIARFILNILLNELLYHPISTDIENNKLDYRIAIINGNIEILFEKNINIFDLYSIDFIYKCIMDNI